MKKELLQKIYFFRFLSAVNLLSGEFKNAVKRSIKFSILLSAVCLLFILQALSASAISVDETDKGSVIIAELDNPAVYDFTITNPDAAENIELYTLLGITFSPRGTFEIQSGKNTLEVRSYPPKSVRQLRQHYIF